MDFSFVEPKTLFLVVHLIGLALGVGGAIMSDLMFFRSIHDWRISKTEMEFLTLASWAVGIGLVLLIMSGLGMFSLDTARYLASTKFLAKMTVVGILAVNAVVLHFWLVPHFKHVAKNNLSTRTSFAERRPVILGAGVISIVSWLSALVLGAFRSIPWPYETIMMIYLCVVFCGFIFALVFRNYLMPVRG